MWERKWQQGFSPLRFLGHVVQWRSRNGRGSVHDSCMYRDFWITGIGFRLADSLLGHHTPGRSRSETIAKPSVIKSANGLSGTDVWIFSGDWMLVLGTSFFHSASSSHECTSVSSYATTFSLNPFKLNADNGVTLMASPSFSRVV